MANCSQSAGDGASANSGALSGYRHPHAQASARPNTTEAHSCSGHNEPSAAELGAVLAHLSARAWAALGLTLHGGIGSWLGGQRGKACDALNRFEAQASARPVGAGGLLAAAESALHCMVSEGHEHSQAHALREAIATAKGVAA